MTKIETAKSVAALVFELEEALDAAIDIERLLKAMDEDDYDGLIERNQSGNDDAFGFTDLQYYISNANREYENILDKVGFSLNA